jgi:hypothetical protein
MFFEDGKDHFEKHDRELVLFIDAAFKRVFNDKPLEMIDDKIIVDEVKKKEQRTKIVHTIKTLFDPDLDPPEPYQNTTTVNQVLNFVFTHKCLNISDPAKKRTLINRWSRTYKENMCPSEEECGGGQKWNLYLDEVDAFLGSGIYGDADRAICEYATGECPAWVGKGTSFPGNGISQEHRAVTGGGRHVHTASASHTAGERTSGIHFNFA